METLRKYIEQEFGEYDFSNVQELSSVVEENLSAKLFYPCQDSLRTQKATSHIHYLHLTGILGHIESLPLKLHMILKDLTKEEILTIASNKMSMASFFVEIFMVIAPVFTNETLKQFDIDNSSLCLLTPKGPLLLEELDVFKTVIALFDVTAADIAIEINMRYKNIHDIGDQRALETYMKQFVFPVLLIDDPESKDRFKKIEQLLLFRRTVEMTYALLEIIKAADSTKDVPDEVILWRKESKDLLSSIPEDLNTVFKVDQKLKDLGMSI